MIGFSDEAYIDVASGNGGAGCASFRREKFIPKGGPDGGDGGKGGDVVFVVSHNSKTLSRFKTKRSFKAENGMDGRSQRCFGQNGRDVVIEVPPGTCIVDAQTGSVVKDMTGCDRYVFLKGGRGGKGNWNFRSSVNQAPRFAQSGEKGSGMRIGLVLKLIADIGLVGFPNAGKSSFINCVTNARSKVDSYPFTTIVPHLGMMKVHGKDILIADIPGIMEGASEGVGMGVKFLKHIERTRALLYMVDMSDSNYENALDVLKAELRAYGVGLASKRCIVAGTKTDVEGASENFRRFREKYVSDTVMPLSVYDGETVRALGEALYGLISD